MKKYRVVVDMTHKEWYEVEASSEKEAKGLAEIMAEEGEEAETYGPTFVSDIRMVGEVE